MKFIFLSILVTVTFQLFGQEQLSIDGYLTSSVTDWEVENILQKGDAVSYKQFRSPWLREVEFRGRSGLHLQKFSQREPETADESGVEKIAATARKKRRAGSQRSARGRFPQRRHYRADWR